MSVHCMSWVLKQSEAKLGARLVLLVLADHAKDDGSASWPAVETIAHEARMSRKGVQDALKRLKADGMIVETGTSRRGTTIYRVEMARGADSAPVQNADPGGEAASARGEAASARGEAATPEPSGTVQEPSAPHKEAPRGEHGEFGEWIGDHSEVTGQEVLKAGTAARKHVAAMFGARREEGYSLEELKLATRGAFADEYRQEHGHFGPESVLRPTKVAGLIEKGRRAQAPKMLRDPLTGMEFAAGTYS